MTLPARYICASHGPRDALVPMCLGWLWSARALENGFPERPPVAGEPTTFIGLTSP